MAISQYHPAAKGRPAWNADKPRQDKLTFIDNTERNTDLSLTPGQYLRIRLRELPNVMVPQTALGSSPFGKYVYVVGTRPTARRRPRPHRWRSGDR